MPHSPTQRDFSFHNLFRFIGQTLLWLVSVLLLACTIVAQDDKKITPLEQNKPIERELAGDAAHSYSITLAANQFLHLVVEQKGIDVVASLFAPDGAKLVEVDSPNGAQGPEPISMVAETAGSYRLEVRSLEATAEAGRYQVKVEEIRAATPLDKTRIAAQKALSEAGEFESEGSASSRRKAIDKYEVAIRFLREANDRPKVAESLSDIGLLYSTLGEKQKALVYYNEALPIMRAVGDREREASTITRIGAVYDDLGEKQKALAFYTEALSINRAIGNHMQEGVTLNNMGTAYNSMGEKQKALDFFNQALPLMRTIRDRSGEASLLNNIAGVYISLGDKQKSLNYYFQALPLRREVGDKSGEATTLSGIALSYYLMSEYQKALEYYNQALPISRAVGDRAGEASTLSGIAGISNSLGDKKKALEYYNQMLLLRRAIGDRGGEANALTSIGSVYGSLGEKTKAIEYLNQALPLDRAVSDRGREAETLARIATVERDRGNLTEARERIEMALTIVESLRAKIANQDLRSSFLATVKDYYDLYIDILMRMHRLHPSGGLNGEALQASERGRARSLLETLAEARADIREGVDAELVDRERTLQQLLNVKARTQMALLSGAHTKMQTEAIAKEIETVTTEFQTIEAEIRQKSPNYAALTQPEPLSLKEIQTQVLDKETLLLEYSLGAEHSYLWAVTPTGVTGYELLNREEIETAAKRFYDLLNARNKRVRDETKVERDTRVAEADREIPSASSELSKMILAPVASQLGKKRLVIVADGVLQYIPFAALPVPSGPRTESRPNESSVGAPLRGRPLIVDHEIVTLPSASTLAVIRREVAGRKPAPKTVVALADPVFEKNDARVKGSINTKSSDPKNVPANGDSETVRELQLVEAAEDTGVVSEGLNVPRLPGSRKEAEEIVAMVPASESKLALDFNANRTVATSEELSQYRYVHFSTHGFLNSVHPELSGIVFSLVNERGETQDGFLRAHEVFNLKLPAELVVLSACQTGIGKEVKGEGLVSLTRGFMYAGAPRVVVSLWSVSEMGTTELMVRFYREMLKKGLRPAAALRAAQISLMKEKRWASPFYWAPFTLQGEWK